MPSDESQPVMSCKGADWPGTRINVCSDLIRAIADDDHDPLQTGVGKAAHRMLEQGASSYAAERLQLGSRSQPAALAGRKQDCSLDHLTRG